MNAQAQSVCVRERLNQIVDEVRFRTHQFAELATHGIDSVHAVSKESGDFVGVEPRAVDHTAGFDGLACRLRAVSLLSSANRDGNGIGSRLESLDARVCQQTCSL